MLCKKTLTTNVFNIHQVQLFMKYGVAKSRERVLGHW